MRALYHYPLHPASRQARIALGEKKLKFSEELVNPWAPDLEFASLSLEAAPPILIEKTSGQMRIIVTSRAICEFAHDVITRLPLLSTDPYERAEARRICEWFAQHFSEDVDALILTEKVEKHVLSLGAPDPAILREGHEALKSHISYLEELLKQRDWLAGRHYSLADIAAAAHISCLDFLGDITWRDWPILKEWYQKVKSRPSMKPILDDRVAGFRPPRHYRDLDF